MTRTRRSIEVDYLPRGTFAYDAARLALALRLVGFAVRRAVRDLLLGWAVR